VKVILSVLAAIAGLLVLDHWLSPPRGTKSAVPAAAKAAPTMVGVHRMGESFDDFLKAAHIDMTACTKERIRPYTDECKALQANGISDATCREPPGRDRHRLQAPVRRAERHPGHRTGRL